MEKPNINPNVCQFLEYIETPGEKFPGVAKVLMYNKLMVLYKWMPTKDGLNYFVSAPSIKIGEKFEHAISVDSRSESTAIENYIRYCILDAINGKSAGTKMQMSGSALQSKPNLDDCPF